MKILFAMTYYRPYVSGPIIYVENLAHELIQRGHEVTILTSHYDPGLPREEVMEGISIVRVPVLFRISKGVIMPTFFATAWRLIAGHDVVAIQVPQFEAPLLALLALLQGVPATMTYHCDVQLPKGWFNRLVDRVVLAGNFLSALLVDRIIAYTRDYALHSPLMSRFLQKVEVIPPPVHMPAPRESAVAGFRALHDLEGKKVVGICARFATEKGFEHLVGAIPLLLEEFPELRILHAGEFENVIGEQEYRERLRPMLERYRENWIPLGVLGGEELAAFFAACDVTVLPSLNRTESFGFVQIESMLNRTPVVASNLPGVRVPVQRTGMGLVTPIGDTEALALNIAEVLRHPSTFHAPREAIEAEFSARRTAAEYLALYQHLLEQKRAGRFRGITQVALLLFGLLAFVVMLLWPAESDR
ncbi:MAG: glycosyltransferase family 4 protein [Chloroflexota bacterium]|nr:glycosyltransferase family 4 protein [Chloroflexota bacterium]